MNAREFSTLFGCPSCRRKSVTPTAVFVRLCPPCRSAGVDGDWRGRGWVIDDSGVDTHLRDATRALRSVRGWPTAIVLPFDMTPEHRADRAGFTMSDQEYERSVGALVFIPSWLHKLRGFIALALNAAANNWRSTRVRLDAGSIVAAHHMLALCCADHDLGQACASIIDQEELEAPGMYVHGSDDEAVLEVWYKVDALCRAARVPR